MHLVCKHLIFYPLLLESPFPSDENIRRSWANLGPNYRNVLVERFFLKEEKSLQNPKGVFAALSLCTHP